MFECAVMVKDRVRLKTSAEYKQLKEEKDRFKRRMLFLGFFAEKLREAGSDAILVGGQAIEVYTGGQFETADIDIVVSNKPLAEKLLNSLGFGKENEIWYNKDLNIIVQLVDKPYSGDESKVRRFKIKDFELKVAAPEDLIVNRLYSAKVWKSNPQRDLEQAAAIMKIFSKSMDFDYLRERAKRNGVEDILDIIEKQFVRS